MERDPISDNGDDQRPDYSAVWRDRYSISIYMIIAFALVGIAGATTFNREVEPDRPRWFIFVVLSVVFLISEAIVIAGVKFLFGESWRLKIVGILLGVAGLFLGGICFMWSFFALYFDAN